MPLPTLTVEVALDQGPTTADGSLSWTEIATPISGFTMRRGRQNNTAKFEPGTCTITFDDSDYEPGDTNWLDELDSASIIGDGAARPGTPVKVTATWDGNDYPVFRGFVQSGWQPDHLRLHEHHVNVTCIDLLGWHQQTILPSSRFGCWAVKNQALVYFDGTMARSVPHNDDTVWNAGTEAFNGHYFTDAGFSSDLVRVDSIVPGSTTGSFLWASNADTDGITADDACADSAEFEVVVWFHNSATTGGPTPMTLFNITNSTEGAGGTVAGALLGATDEVTATIALPSGGGSFSVTTTATDSFRDGETHLARILYEASSGTSGNRRIRLFTDLDNATTTGLTQRATIGGGYVGVSDFGTAFPVGVVSDLAYFDHFTDGDFFTFGLDEAAAGRDLLWAGDTIEDRISNAFAAAGIPEPTTITVEDQVGGSLDDIVPGRSLTETIRNAAGAFGGDAYMGRDGTLYAHNFSGVYTTGGVSKGTGGAHFITNSPRQGFPVGTIHTWKRAGRTGSRIDRVVNEVTLTSSEIQTTGFTSSYNGGADYNIAGVVTFRDDDSVARYGLRRFDASSEAAEEDDLLTWGQWLIENFADPPTEITGVVFQPVGNGNSDYDDPLIEWLLGLELADGAAYAEYESTGTTPGGDLAFGVNMIIDAESWSYTAGQNWTVTLNISENTED